MRRSNAVLGHHQGFRGQGSLGCSWYTTSSVSKTGQLRKKETITISSREPIVIVPLSVWRRAEEFLEDQEALASRRYRGRIRKARIDAAAGKRIRPFE